MISFGVANAMEIQALHKLHDPKPVSRAILVQDLG